MVPRVIHMGREKRLKGVISPLTLTAQEKGNPPNAPCLIFMAAALSAALRLFPTAVDSWGAAATAPLNIKQAFWRAGARWLLLSSRKIPAGRDDAVTFRAPITRRQFRPRGPKGDHGAAGAGSAPRSPRRALNKAQPRAAPVRSYLLRTRDKNLFTYKFSPLPRQCVLLAVGFRVLMQKTCRSSLGSASFHVFHARRGEFVVRLPKAPRGCCMKPASFPGILVVQTCADWKTQPHN